MENFKKLSKEEMKMVVGGDAQAIDGGGSFSCAKQQYGTCAYDCFGESGKGTCSTNDSGMCTCGGV